MISAKKLIRFYSIQKTPADILKDFLTVSKADWWGKRKEKKNQIKKCFFFVEKSLQ